jgi:VWFA-related protein
MLSCRDLLLTIDRKEIAMRNALLTRFGFACVLFACVVGATIMTRSQAQRPTRQQNPDKVVVNTGEVLLDVVVRDKSGRLRKDLNASDFEVYEDGVRQEISSFRLVSPTSEKGAATKGGDQETDRGNQQSKRGDQQSQSNASGLTRSARDSGEVPGVSAVALVFDRLSPSSRTSAYKAALSYVDESVNKDELFGVFLTDLSVVVLQPFTDNRQLVKSGIEKAGMYSPSLYNSTNEKARDTRQALTNIMESRENPNSPKEGLPPASTALSLTAKGALASLALGMLEKEEMDQRDELGDATARGLLHIASSLRALPGRKAVIFLSEGLILPPSVMQTFPAIISAANRNNVSFYTVDAAGLRAESKTLETTKEIESRSKFRMAQLGNNADADGPMTQGLERNEDLLRLNPDSGLGRLANETGGFLITDSNDLKGRLRRIDEDLHAYYLMSYRSNNQNYDGHFRKIEVKVKRSGLDVQSRKGYFAIKGTFASPVLSYEAPAIAALENAPKANSFPFYAGGFSFPERERMGLATVLADVPLSAFSFNADQEKKVYNTDFSILALLKDQTGEVVDKVSKQYRLSGPLDKLDEERRGRVLFYREADLAPGRYTLETIAYDAPTGHSSVRAGTIEVLASDESKLRLSDVVILNRAEAVSAKDDKRSNPFRVANMIVSPNLGESIHRSLKQVPFFFTVYTAAGTSPRPKLTIELRQQGHTLAQIPGEMPEADASGRIQYVAGLPLEKIPAGAYELRIAVGDGTTSVTRSGYFTIKD